MVKALKLYFAAPLFTQAEWQWNERLAGELRKLGLEVILPQTRAEPMLKHEQSFDACALFAANIAGIEEADFVVAVLDQPILTRGRLGSAAMPTSSVGLLSVYGQIYIEPRMPLMRLRT